MSDKQSVTTAAPDLIRRDQVMWLIEQTMREWPDDCPPRHALSVLWGKVRDLTDADTMERQQMDYEQYQSTVSA